MVQLGGRERCQSGVREGGVVPIAGAGGMCIERGSIRSAVSTERFASERCIAKLLSA